MQYSLLQEGLNLMLIGMGTVFAFLTTLVVAMTVMSRALARLPGGRETALQRDERAEIAAIAAAVRAHRRRQAVDPGRR